MTRRRLASIAASALLFAMNMCSAAPIISPHSPAAKAFERACVSAHEDCMYEYLSFESARKASIEGHVYKILENKRDINAYNTLIKAYLTPGMVQGLKSFSVKHYDRDTETWAAFLGTKTCRYCVDTHVLKRKHPELLRIDLTKHFVKSDGYIVTGLAVYQDQRLKARINVSAPSLSDSKDQSPIYIDSRIKGKHATTSFTEGGITLDLDGKEVPGILPDYVAISSTKSWAVVAARYRRHEAALLNGTNRLPGSRKGTQEQRIGRVTQQLQAYRIRYDAVMQGTFPSLSPNQVIANRHGDCKALATLAGALLRRVGIPAHSVLLSASSQPPLSFNVPGPFWNPLHVILYLPSIDVYIDPSRIASLGADWKRSASTYRGAIALDMTTGRFVAIH